jgi:hypothetical protein
MKAWRSLWRIAGIVSSLSALAAGQDIEPTSDVGVGAAAEEQAEIPYGGMSVAPEPSSPAEESSSPAENPSASLSIAPDAATQAQVRSRLASGTFRFCTSDNYRLWQLDRDRLCQKLPDLAADCPGLVAACARPAWDEMVANEPAPSWLTQLASFLGSWGGEAFRAAFWLALGFGALYLARGLFRAVRLANEAEAPARRQTTVEAEDIDPAAQPAATLLERASQYLEEGDSRRALHFAYAALLAGLAQVGILRVHRALTSGDYRRSLARSHPEHTAGGLLRALDLARFQPAVEGDGARRLTSQVRELLSRLLLALLILGLPGCGDTMDQESPAEPTAPRGFALFEGLASDQAPSFSRRLRRVTELPSGTTAVVVVGANLRELEWQTLERFVDSGGHLVLAGETEGLTEAFGLTNTTAPCTGPIRVDDLDVETPDTKETTLAGLLPASAEVVIASCGTVEFARVHLYGDGQITLVGDGRIFDNTSLSLAENASFVRALIDSQPGHMEFIGPWTGAGAVHPLESIARSSVGPWLLHVLAVFTLLAWSRGKRFGSPRPAAPSARRSLLEHARALAGHYQRQGDLGAALARYASWAVTLLGRRSGSSSGDLRALSLALASKHEGQNKRDEGQPESSADLHQLLLRARAAAELGGDRQKLMRAYRTLRRMVEEVSSQK